MRRKPSQSTMRAREIIDELDRLETVREAWQARAKTNEGTLFGEHACRVLAWLTKREKALIAEMPGEAGDEEVMQ